MIFTIVAADNDSPDPALAGHLAVETPTNTGFASTVATASGGTDSQFKSILWFAFTAMPSNATAAEIKVDYVREGTLSDGGIDTANEFRLERSLDGGSNFFIFHSETQVTSSDSDTASFTITLPQDLTDVQVRATLSAEKTGATSATLTATVSNVRIEVTAPTSQLIVMM